MQSSVFNSCFAPFLQRFIEFKRLQGYAYSGRNQLHCLKQLDQCACTLKWPSPCLKSDFFTAYERSLEHLGLRSRYANLCALRVFSKYLHRCNPSSQIYLKPFIKPKPTPGYIYSEHELRRILIAAAKLKPELRAQTYTTMISLMSTTGLRPGEAVNLKVADFDAKRGTLFIQKSKMGKDRLIPVAPSTVAALTRYLDSRNVLSPEKPCSCFFLNRPGKALNLSTAQDNFRRLLSTAEIHGYSVSKRRPRLHDWRHTFAVNCLLRWHYSGVDANARLPILATYLGHVSIVETQLYLQATPELMHSSRQRFSDYINTAQNQWRDSLVKEESHG